MKIRIKLVSHLKLMHSLLTKSILIAGLAIATQNVMAIHPCDSLNCCGPSNSAAKSCMGDNGLLATCNAVVNDCPEAY